MNLFLKGAYGRNAFDSEVKVFFGLGPKDKWPEQGLPRRNIQGIECWVDPAPIAKTVMRWGKEVRVKSSKHRTFGICPACKATIPLGRMEQHSKVHTR